jgi:P4 family phage/plasmid primase-like protien
MREAGAMADAIRDTLAVLEGSGQVVEVRALAENGTHSGYFTDYEALARQVEALDCDPAVHGCYVTLNDVNPALVARRANRIKMYLSRTDATTGDADILRRRWLPIDIDPVRPSGVSSTDAEHALAMAKADEVSAWLAGLGFPEPVRGDSGNGAHLLYRIDLPNDDAATNLVKAVLSVLDNRFSDAGVTVDPANYNAGRIWKLYGMMVRKGDSTTERPHRRSRIISVPDSGAAVTAEQLQELCGWRPIGEQVPAEVPMEIKGYKNITNLPDWLNGYGIIVKCQKPYAGGTIFTLDQCPFSSAHKDGAYAIQFANGAIHAGCHHASCGAGRQRWKELRERYETPEEKHARQDARIKGWGRERAKGKATEETRPVLPPGTPEKVALPEYPMTDAGNAERLKARYGDVIRYCATYNAWYLWDGTVWVRDDAGRMLIIATEVARSIHREAAGAPTPERSRALSRWAIYSESLHARKAMIDSAAPHIPVVPGEFDSHPDLFNCRNGTLHLTTMDFYPHTKEDLLTKMAAVDYDPAAECPQWLAHLNLIFAGDDEYLAGFQAMCGYTLLGTNPQQLMFILYGKGRNGKSKTIEVLARIFANYAVNIASDSLMAKRFETTRSDLARLSGARFATAAEGAEGARMDESIIKQITGEYAITARKLYENEFEFCPTSKIWLTTNHEPNIAGTDDGIWRRLWMLPFVVQIPEDKCDPDIASKLLSESSGILNWCLAGLSRYHANGNRLVPPKRVSQATANLRTVSDTVGLFLATECTFEAGSWISRMAMNEMFEKWCNEEGIKQTISKKRLFAALRERGVGEGPRIGYDRSWSGVRCKNDAERIAVEQQQRGQDVLPLS